MKKLIAFLLLSFPLILFAQNNDDNKVIITLTNDQNVYNKVKDAFILMDFIVKDLSYRDTIVTYPYDFRKIDGFVICKAIINGNRVTLSGEWGKSGANLTNDNVKPKNYIPIIYYRRSMTWQLLIEIARKIGGEISFSK